MTRSYSSDKRAAAAAQTRQKVLEAAGQLMAERGYGRTTMRDIAASAKVSPQTVNLLGPKARLVAEALAQSFMGDPDATELGTGEQMRRVMATPDTSTALREYFAILADANARSCRLALAMKAGADVDDAVRILVEEGETHRRNDMQLAATWMLSRGLITPDDVERAAAVHALITSVETCHHLVVTNGWSVDRYAEWLSQAFECVVLQHGPPHSTPHQSPSER